MAAQKSLAEAIKHLKKQVGDALEYAKSIREVIPTGSIAVDKVIGIGGFPRGRITEVFGWESSGKTTLCLTAAAKAQKKGMFCAYLDVERGVDLAHAKRIGFDFEDETKGLYSTPFSMEETFTIVETLALTGQAPLIIVDSIPSMVPQKELDGDIDETAGGLGLRSRLLAGFLARITKTIDKTNTALVLCNQMRARIATDRFDFGPKEQAAGGSALKFYTSIRIDLHRGAEIKVERTVGGEEKKVTIGNWHTVDVLKNKMAMPFKTTKFPIMYDEEHNFFGIDNLRTVLDMAKDAGFITSKGAGYFSLTIDGTVISLRGTDELYGFFLKPENQTTFTKMKESLGL